LVSIIVPNFNHQPFLKKRLDSIFNQTYQDFEVILLDDASTDNSCDILNQFSNHEKVSHFIDNESNSGSPFNQWSKGIELAQGEYIWIAESDDYADLRFLEILLPKFDDKISLVYCQSNRVMADGRGNGDWLKHTREFEPNIFENDFTIDGNLFIEKYLIHKNVIPNVSAVLWKSNNLKSRTPLDFPPYMRLNADWYFYLQVVCNSKIYFHADSLNFFRYHEQSVIAKADKSESQIYLTNESLFCHEHRISYIKKVRPNNFNQILNQGALVRERWIRYKILLHSRNNEFLSVFMVLRKEPKLFSYTMELLFIKTPMKFFKSKFKQLFKRIK
jgi:glycosyltransferase involved in cell wall biosynthesis